MHVLAYAMLLVLSLGHPVVLSAQISALATGDRVRVWTQASPQAGSERVTGEIGLWTRDTLRLRVDSAAQERVIALSSVTRLDVSRGLRHRGVGALRSGAKGLVVGALVGVGIRVVSGGNRGDGYLDDWFFDWAVPAILGGAPGTLIGAVRGANDPGERWHRVLPAP